MTKITEVASLYGMLVRNVLGQLEEFGFRRSGDLARVVKGENCAIVQFQKSRSSLLEEVRFTVNLGVANRSLLFDWQSFDKLDAFAAHLQVRLGQVLPVAQSDRWWVIDQSTNMAELGAEITEALRVHGVPFLLKYLSSIALLEYFESGKGGLPEKQGRLYIDGLKRTLGNT